MRSIIRRTVFNAISLYLLSQFLPGVKISGGIKMLLISGFLLAVLFKLLKPVLNILSLPLNMVTLGLFSFLTNAIVLYVLTILVPNIQITQFTFNGWFFAGFIIPVMHFNTFYAFIIAAALLSLIINFFDWLTNK